MRNKKEALIIFIMVFFLGCETTPWLNKNIKIEKVSADSPAKDQVVVSVVVLNENDIKGKIVVSAEVNCGTVSWKEKKKKAEIPANSKYSITIEFKGIKDRIPTMSKKFE